MYNILIDLMSVLILFRGSVWLEFCCRDTPSGNHEYKKTPTYGWYHPSLIFSYANTQTQRQVPQHQ